MTVTREGTRPLLVEVQALVDQTNLGNPRRLAVGSDGNRLAMLLAILHRHGGLAVHDQDVFVNVVGGVRLSETAADLAVVAAIVSSFRDRPIAEQTIVVGELGLSGEVRPVPYGEERLREAAKHGFTRALAPSTNIPKRAISGLRTVAVDTLSALIDELDPTIRFSLLPVRTEPRVIRKNPSSFYRVVSSLNDLDGIASDTKAYTLNWHGLEMLENEPVDGFRSIHWQLPLHRTVEFANTCSTVDQEASIFLRMHIFAQVIWGGGELTDDLLENVRKGHQALNVAVLVNHESDALRATLEVK